MIPTGWCSDPLFPSWWCCGAFTRWSRAVGSNSMRRGHWRLYLPLISASPTLSAFWSTMMQLAWITILLTHAGAAMHIGDLPSPPWSSEIVSQNKPSFLSLLLEIFSHSDKKIGCSQEGIIEPLRPQFPYVQSIADGKYDMCRSEKLQGTGVIPWLGPEKKAQRIKCLLNNHENPRTLGKARYKRVHL